MAETKKAKPKKAAKRTTGAGSKAKAKAKPSGGANRASAKARNGASKGKEAASSNGGAAAHSIAPTLQKVGLPLVAAGAAVAGAAAVVVSKTGRKRKVLGVALPKRSNLPRPTGKGIRGEVRKAAGAVTEAAKQADRVGQGISQVASSVQAVGETANDAAKKS